MQFFTTRCVGLIKHVLFVDSIICSIVPVYSRLHAGSDWIGIFFNLSRRFGKYAQASRTHHLQSTEYMHIKAILISCRYNRPKFPKACFCAEKVGAYRVDNKVRI